MTDLLREAGWQLDWVREAAAARHWMEENGLPALAAVDLGLPNREGWRLCRELAQIAGLPLLALAAEGESLEGVLEALRYADDVVRRPPCSPQELAMRIQRILSRVGDYAYASGLDIWLHKGLSVNLVRGQVALRGEVRRLTKTECALLSVLLTHWGKVVSSDTLLERAWRASQVPGDYNALRVHVHRLRRNTEDNPHNPTLILTDRNEGYQLSRAKG